jgi:hypothetical protein
VTDICLCSHVGILKGFSKRSFEKCLRHHQEHTLLFLRDPEARNECSDADKEWRDNRAITEHKERRHRTAPRVFSPCTRAYQNRADCAVLAVRATYNLLIIVGNSPNDSH